MPDTDLRHQVASLLKRGPYMHQEIERYCRQFAPNDVFMELRAMEKDGVVKYHGAMGLYALGPG